MILRSDYTVVNVKPRNRFLHKGLLENMRLISSRSRLLQIFHLAAATRIAVFQVRFGSALSSHLVI